jgi:hypothetical protein
MPFYDATCRDCGVEGTVFLYYAQFDAAKRRGGTKCYVCNGLADFKVNKPNLYGLMRCKDAAFADAEEATGERINSTKDIDRLEKAGVIRAVTNPSRARKFKDKR